VKVMDRLSTLIRADAHGVMDRLEEHSLLVRQHLRDAEIALEHDRVRLAALEEERRRLDAATRRAEARLAELDADVALALERLEEELARYAVRRLLPQRDALRARRERAAELAAARERLAARLRERETAFADLRTRARARLAELERAAPEPAAPAAEVADEEIDLELLRRRAGGPASGEVTT